MIIVIIPLPEPLCRRCFPPIRIIKTCFYYFSNISCVMACNVVPNPPPNIWTNLPPSSCFFETLKGEIKWNAKINFFGLQYTKNFFRFPDFGFLKNSRDFSFTILGIRTIAPEENCHPVRFRVSFRIEGQFSLGAIVLEPRLSCRGFPVQRTLQLFIDFTWKVLLVSSD